MSKKKYWIKTFHSVFLIFLPRVLKNKLVPSFTNMFVENLLGQLKTLFASRQITVWLQE